ncbi:MAG: hypothetical protein ACRD15_17780 [Vicinamibacterales bacterium]
MTPDKSGIDFEGMTGETRDKLRQLLASPEAQAQLGITQPAGDGPAAPELPTEALMGPLFESVGMLLAGLAQRAGYSETQARVLLYSAEEQALLGPLTAKVIDKHFPSGLGRYQEEIALAVVLGGITIRKVQAMKDAAGGPAPIAEEKRESAPTHTVQ